MKTSLCMIVRDEELALPHCLDSVRGIFDEIIIVDTGSTDSTPEIAKRYTDRVYSFEWRDDFSAARNYAFSLATGDYLMWLDADDRLEGENRNLLWDVLGELETLRPDVVMLPYHVAFDEAGRPTVSYERERIVRARAGFQFIGAVHEAIPPRGTVIHRSAAICHRKLRPNPPGRNLAIFERQLSNGVALEPRMRYYYARELREAGRTEDAVENYRLCAEDNGTWVENRISALVELSCCLRELGRDAEAEEALLKTLTLGEPRADVCCELGRILLQRGELNGAKLWYSLAPGMYKRSQGGFLHSDYGDYIPYMQLCVICDRLGERSLSESFNELAGKIRETPEYLHNKLYFARLRQTN